MPSSHLSAFSKFQRSLAVHRQAKAAARHGPGNAPTGISPFGKCFTSGRPFTLTAIDCVRRFIFINHRALGFHP